MAKDLNKVMLTGNLGADPEMRYTERGSAVTTFRVASNRTWKDSQGESHEDTEWFRVVAWDRLGEICNEYLRKGTRVYIEGRLQTRRWQDQNGQDRYMTEVIASDMIILSSRQERSGSGTGYEYEAPEDDITEAAPAAASSRRAPAPRAPNGNARSTSRTPARNVPQAIESDEDLPF